jgi:hypothetical protein
MGIPGLPLTSKNPNRESERTRELKGYIIYESAGLSGELNPNEKIFLEILEKRIRKKIKGFKSHGIQLKSFNIMFEK